MNGRTLSDWISRLVEHSSDLEYPQFRDAFLDATVGLAVAGLPAGLDHGQKVVVTSSMIARLEVVEDGEGRSLLKVLADPVQFERQFKAGVNATMLGNEVMHLALETEGIDGVLVCSAASFHSCPIYTEEFE